MGLELLLDPDPSVVLGVFSEPGHGDVDGLVVGIAHHAALHHLHVSDCEDERPGRRERGFSAMEGGGCGGEG